MAYVTWIIVLKEVKVKHTERIHHFHLSPIP